MQCHLSIHVFPCSFIYCYDLKSSVFSFDKMANQLMNIDIVVKKMIQQDQIPLLVSLFALLGHPHLSYHIHPVNEVIHRGIGINTLDESTCAFISNPKNDIFSLTVHIPKLTVKSENFQNDNIHKVYPGPKSTDVCSCAAASPFSRWISSMNETLQFVYNQSTH